MVLQHFLKIAVAFLTNAGCWQASSCSNKCPYRLLYFPHRAPCRPGKKKSDNIDKKNVFLQIICFFKKIHCAVPGLSFMYSFQGNTLNKVVYDYWLQIQVLHCNFSSHAVPAFLGKSNL